LTIGGNSLDRAKFEKIHASLEPLPINPSHPLQTGKEEMFHLVNIVEKINPERIMEIGILMGGSLKFWEQILPEGGLLIGLDHWRHMRAWDFDESDRQIEVIYKDSKDETAVDDVKKLLDGELLDFLYIDGNHTISYVKNDFERYEPLVRKGGIVAFDDVYNVEGGPPMTLFPILVRAGDWIVKPDSKADDYVPKFEEVIHSVEKTPIIKGKRMLINYGSPVGVWWKE